MKALIFDKTKTWEKSKGFELADVPKPVLDEKKNPEDRQSVLIKVLFAGVCGTDRGIWHRTAFRDQILSTIDQENKGYRILGHELFGEIVEAGSEVEKLYNLKPGDEVSSDSHVVCDDCHQCGIGQKHVCTNEKILGVTQDGVFAEYVKIPGHVIWKNDTSKIRPEVAAIQDPFGNAVHAATKVDLKGKTVAIFGLGPIGQFVVLIAKAVGAKKVIGIEPNPVAQKMAKKLGIDEVIPLKLKKGKGYKHDQKVVDQILELTDGLGADVSLEMAGVNSSLNNSIFATRRGGDVILFGLKSADFVLEDYNSLVFKGLTLHALIGRQIWSTWEKIKKLLEDEDAGVQDKIYKIILNEAKDTVIPISEFEPNSFEEKMEKYPKLVLKF